MCYSGSGHTLVSRMILFSEINSYTLILSYNEQLRDAKHMRRQLERKWRHTKAKSDHEAYRKQCSVVAKD